ncbi:MAG: hypothetical protein ACRENE_27365 [Polyangiaceae bacterium]
MKLRRLPLPLLSLCALGAAVACESVPDDQGSGLYPASGAIRGNVVYSGPHPCSSNGHIVGNGLVLLFDRRNLPPPNGLATTALNFAVVDGDILFANEPRNQGRDVYCPTAHGVTDTITATAPFAMSPLAGGSYILEAFFDTTGDFYPNFKYRELPEEGDVGGGAIDTADALKTINAGNLNYQPRFLPVNVGIPGPAPSAAAVDAGPAADAGDAGASSGVAGPAPVAVYTIPPDGFIADDVTVTMGEVLPLTRPYFFPQGAQLPFDHSQNTTQVGPDDIQGNPPMPAAGSVDIGNVDYAPVLTIPQDIEVYAPPNTVTQQNVQRFEDRFPHLVLTAGVPASEASFAVAQPLHLQVPSGGAGTIAVWQNATLDPASQLWVPQDIPEGNAVPQLWPLVVLTKLVDDPGHAQDPASLQQQGSQTSTEVDPVVVLQAITLLGESAEGVTNVPSLYDTTLHGGSAMFDPSGRPKVAQQHQLTVLLRPNVICFDNLFDDSISDKRGTLVTPYLTGLTADAVNPTPGSPIVAPSVLQNPSIAALVKGAPVTACLPTGRYAINIVYPDGQAWTVPNETGACSMSEGATVAGDAGPSVLTCSAKPRPVLRSQGPRAVVEITKATDPDHCQGYQQVPAVCLPHAPGALMQ